jgi:xanthosine utilization system XapX-like protein
VSAAPQAAGAIWRWPIVLGVATAVGLLSALLGDAVWDALSWVVLGAPVAVAAWFASRPAPQ